MAQVREAQGRADTFIMTLSREEAEAIHLLVGSVTGSSTKSPRKYTRDIYYALSGVGLDPFKNLSLVETAANLSNYNE